MKFLNKHSLNKYCSIKYRKRRLLKALTKAQELYNSDKYVKAIGLYGRILEMIDESETRRRASIFEKIGDMYNEHELYADAKAAYEKAVAAEPNLSHVRFSLGICYSELKETADAKEQFAHAFWLVADDSSDLRRGASYLESNGWTDLADAWTERAEKLDSQKSWKNE